MSPAQWVPAADDPLGHVAKLVANACHARARVLRSEGARSGVLSRSGPRISAHVRHLAKPGRSCEAQWVRHGARWWRGPNCFAAGRREPITCAPHSQRRRVEQSAATPDLPDRRPRAALLPRLHRRDSTSHPRHGPLSLRHTRGPLEREHLGPTLDSRAQGLHSNAGVADPRGDAPRSGVRPQAGVLGALPA